MKKDKVYLLHIKDAMKNIEEFTVGLSKEEFFKNTLVQSVVIRQIEIIGEATKNLSAERKHVYKNIPWKDIAGMRDMLIHEYFGVDLEAVWHTIKEDIPGLKKQLE